jgi:hypothetical protein
MHNLGVLANMTFSLTGIPQIQNPTINFALFAFRECTYQLPSFLSAWYGTEGEDPLLSFQFTQTT